MILTDPARTITIAQPRGFHGPSLTVASSGNCSGAGPAAAPTCTRTRH